MLTARAWYGDSTLRELLILVNMLLKFGSVGCSNDGSWPMLRFVSKLTLLHVVIAGEYCNVLGLGKGARGVSVTSSSESSTVAENLGRRAAVRAMA